MLSWYVCIVLQARRGGFRLHWSLWKTQNSFNRNVYLLSFQIRPGRKWMLLLIRVTRCPLNLLFNYTITSGGKQGQQGSWSALLTHLINEAKTAAGTMPPRFKHKPRWRQTNDVFVHSMHFLRLPFKFTCPFLTPKTSGDGFSHSSLETWKGPPQPKPIKDLDCGQKSRKTGKALSQSKPMEML